MNKPAIEMWNLSKAYKLGRRREQRDTLVGAMLDMVKAPVRNFRELRELSNFKSERSQDFIWALQDVSLTIHQGDVCGFVGRNGAGKSTLLKILSRIVHPTRGRARIRGRVASLLEIGTGFHPDLTGRENTYLNGTILGMRKEEIDRKFDEIVAFAGVDKFIDTPVKRYSSGMRVRLAFAVAAHLESEILIVDEVLAVGDAEFQRKCLGRMRDVSSGGRTVLFVSHNMAAVAQLCARVVWLDEGAIKDVGEPQSIIHKYLSVGEIDRASRAWKYPGNAPGDDRVRLVGVRVIQDGRTSDVIDINQNMIIEFELSVLKEVRNFVTGISFYDAEGLCLFANCDWRENRMAPGLYKKAVTLPAQFLAEGTIRVLVQGIFSDPDIRSFVLPDVLTFEAVESQSVQSVRGPYKGTWPGVLRVALNWGDPRRIE